MVQLRTELPKIFDEFADARKTGFLAMKELKDQGKGVVGTFCTYTPLEIFYAADLVPVGLCATSDETVAEAEKDLPANLCPLIKSSYGFAVTDKCPYMYFSDLVVGETTCDGKKKMYELLGNHKNVHVMQLPQEQKTQGSYDLWRSEIVRLIDRVETDFNVEITEEKLADAIEKKNLERALVKEVYELNTAHPPMMTGLHQLRVMFGQQFKFTWEDKINSLRQVIDETKAAYEAGDRPVSEKAPRILITGCPMGGATEKVVEAIENNGATVVAFENCTGAKQYDRQIPTEGNPIDNITRHYLDIGCAVMTPDTNRLDLLDKLCDQFQVDGVVEMSLQSCQPYMIEATTIKQHIIGKGIPYLYLETDYGQADVGQLSTRAGAFIEML